MIVEGIVQKKGFFGLEIDNGEKSIPMTTGNTVMYSVLREAANKKTQVKLEGAMETVLFKKKFVPMRFL